MQSGVWHAYLNDFCHTFHGDDINGFTKIYDSLATVVKMIYILHINPRCSCAEVWYWNYIKKHLKLKFRSSKLGARIRRG